MFKTLMNKLMGVTPPKKTPRPPRPRRTGYVQPTQTVVPYVIPDGAESQVRTHLLDSMLKCTHGDLNHFQALHRAALDRDPLFYGHLAGWYMLHGSVRDHQELFVANLLAAAFPDHREHGRVLLQRLRPYQVARLVRFTKESLHYPTRIMKSAVEFYLRRREADASWFDECVMRDRKSIRYLYASLHIKPSERAEQLVFQHRAPADSRVFGVSLLSRCQDNPARQAELILEHHIHFTTAIGAIRHYTPAVIYALVKVMTGPQLITNLSFLQKRGALDHPHLREAIDAKLKDAVRDNRVSDLKTGVALKQVATDAALARELMNLTQERLRNRGRLKLPTALFVDKSGSMEQALQVGKLLASVCSTVADDALYVYAFDSHAFPVRPRSMSYADWERAFQPLRADGATSIGAPFRSMREERVEQIVVITDGEENTAPMFRPALEEYEQKHGVKCQVTIIRVGPNRGQPSPLETALAGRETTVINFNGDYYSIPNIVPMLCCTTYELVEEVLSVPLFQKADLQTLPPGFNPETFEIL